MPGVIFSPFFLVSVIPNIQKQTVPSEVFGSLKKNEDDDDDD